MVAPGGWGRAWDRTRYGDMINQRVVRILLECILVRNLCTLYFSSTTFKGKLLYYFDHRNYKPLCGLNSVNHAIISVTTIISCVLSSDGS